MYQRQDLASLADEYLQMRRGLGFKLVTFSRSLHGFLRFMNEQHEPFITTNLAVKWAIECSRSTDRYTLGRRLMVVRIFARYANSFDVRNEIPPADILSCSTRRSVPYIYRDDEVAALMQAAAGMLPPFRGKTLSTFIGLLAATGMRTGEIHRLNIEDVDLNDGIIHIHDAKFLKSRDIPLHPSTVAALTDYCQRRNSFMGHTDGTSAFFVNMRKVRFKDQSPTSCFAELLRRAGITPVNRPRPRLHDLRHSFATKTLTGWYEQGCDVSAQMPVLSTYLGHVDPKATYWYLTGTTELMGLAAAKLTAAMEIREN